MGVMDTHHRNYLRICYSTDLVDGQPMYVSSNCLPVKAANFEPAGHSFHAAVLRILGFYEDEEAETDDPSLSSEKGQDHKPSEFYSGKSKRKMGAEGKQQDHYALLGLSHLRFLATEDQIRKSYRETALKYHPDKQAALILAEETEAAKQAKKDEIENHFKAIQEAYEVLIDPVKRRIYDSTDEFDDEIPAECAPSDFFKVYGPVFMRNARWSVFQPVPSLGDDGTPVSAVDNFYNFWYSFKSWREFPHADEFDLEQAESRDHKRWMERQNAKLTEKARKEEYARIRTLVDNAYKRDPRILRRKEEEKAEKQRRKEAKLLARKLQEEKAVRCAEEEKQQKEELERKAAEAALNQKKQKEKEKKLLRKERTRLRTLATPVVSNNMMGLSESDIESLCMSLEMNQLRHLCNDLEQKVGIDQAKLLKDALRGDNVNEGTMSQENGSVGPESSSNAAIPPVACDGLLCSYEKKEKPWSRDEVELLRKGMQKYPKGTSRRWEVISEYIATGRSVEEILKATKTVLLQKPDSAKAFESFLEKRKPAQTIASPLTTRDESESVPAVNIENGLSHTETSTSGHKSSHSAEMESVNDSSSEQDVWSVTQERALIQALKTFPKETNQRWERVAAAVPGKTVNQCKKKFLIMKESFRSKKVPTN
ncbi:uncharacterized protein LOC116260849 [Nymphaea colorata]|nr:uncharacterized protein LOC116260849 [Nymphaea colorata]XP_031495229.1 uncharacterized protein LOC116260849 [Nymphaea colorata]